MKAIMVFISVALAVSLTPAPRVRIENPKLLYAAAMYKTAIGDTDAAVRFLHRAEKAEQAEHAPNGRPASLQCSDSVAAASTIL